MVNRTQRKRGVKADRQKLEHALFAAGFKTQAALAEHIATLENLDSAPKDMVNRVFRQIAVSPSSIERIAAALNVDAYTLYLSSSSEIQDTKPTNNEIKLKQNPRLKYATLAALALITIFAVWFISLKTNVKHTELNPINSSNLLIEHFKQVLSTGTTPSLALYGGHQHKDLLKKMRDNLQAHFNIVPNTVTSSPEAIISSYETEKKQIDFIFVLNAKAYGRYVLQEAYLANKKHRLKVEQGFYVAEEIEHRFRYYCDKTFNVYQTVISKWLNR